MAAVTRDNMGLYGDVDENGEIQVIDEDGYGEAVGAPVEAIGTPQPYMPSGNANGGVEVLNPERPYMDAEVADDIIDDPMLYGEDLENATPVFASGENEILYGDEPAGNAPPPIIQSSVIYGDDEDDAPPALPPSRRQPEPQIVYGADEGTVSNQGNTAKPADENFYGDSDDDRPDYDLADQEPEPENFYGDEEGQDDNFYGDPDEDNMYGDIDDGVQNVTQGVRSVSMSQQGPPKLPARHPGATDSPRGSPRLPPREPARHHTGRPLPPPNARSAPKPQAGRPQENNIRRMRYGDIVHVDIGRVAAEQRIRNKVSGQHPQFASGTFLIRTSERVLGGIVVSMIFEDKFYHFQFGKNDKGYYVNSKGKVIGDEPNIIGFMDYFKKRKDGMPTTLGTLIMPTR
eukprot:m.38930 g.38930  ORF g.38930 m.38930 type:complete len:402 (+) comp9493_c1_seq1:182-1387(+)